MFFFYCRSCIVENKRVVLILSKTNSQPWEQRHPFSGGVAQTGGGQWASDMWCDAHSASAIYYTYENWKINMPRAWRAEIALYPIAHPISAPLCIQIIGDTASRRQYFAPLFLSLLFFGPFYSGPAALCESLDTSEREIAVDTRPSGTLCASSVGVSCPPRAFVFAHRKAKSGGIHFNLFFEAEIACTSAL